MRPASDLPTALVDLRALHFVAPDGVPLATGMVEESTGRTKSDNRPLTTAASIAAFLIDDSNSDQDRQTLLDAASGSCG